MKRKEGRRWTELGLGFSFEGRKREV